MKNETKIQKETDSKYKFSLIPQNEEFIYIDDSMFSNITIEKKILENPMFTTIKDDSKLKNKFSN